MNSVDLAQPLHEWRDLVGGEKEEVRTEKYSLFFFNVYLSVSVCLCISNYIELSVLIHLSIFVPVCVCLVTGREARGHLHLSALRPHSR